MNVEIGTEAVQFLSLEYINRIFFAVYNTVSKEFWGLFFLERSCPEKVIIYFWVFFHPRFLFLFCLNWAELPELFIGPLPRILYLLQKLV
jgi:hypothetical protein